MKQQNTIGFADLAITGRKIKEDFFNQVNKLIDWKSIEKLIGKYYFTFAAYIENYRNFVESQRLIYQVE